LAPVLTESVPNTILVKEKRVGIRSVDIRKKRMPKATDNSLVLRKKWHTALPQHDVKHSYMENDDEQGFGEKRTYELNKAIQEALEQPLNR
jgi:hypothetical protein